MLILFSTMKLREDQNLVYGHGVYGDGDHAGGGNGRGVGDGYPYGDGCYGGGDSLNTTRLDAEVARVGHKYFPQCGPALWMSLAPEAMGFIGVVVFVAARSRRC